MFWSVNPVTLFLCLSNADKHYFFVCNLLLTNDTNAPRNATRSEKSRFCNTKLQGYTNNLFCNSLISIDVQDEHYVQENNAKKENKYFILGLHFSIILCTFAIGMQSFKIQVASTYLTPCINPVQNIENM